MNVQVVYCNHQTTDLAVREQLAFSSEDQLHIAYQQLLEDHPDSEIVVLSTLSLIHI